MSTTRIFGRNFAFAVVPLRFGIVLYGDIDVRVLLDEVGSSAPGVRCIDNIADIAFWERKLGTIILWHLSLLIMFYFILFYTINS